MNKPFSQACENNKQPILGVLKDVFDLPCELLEIGSGTGQHAVFFAEHLPHITWQPTDQAEYLEGIAQWVNEADLANLKNPLKLDVRDNPWPYQQLEAVFTANTLHIMGWEEVEIFFARLGEYLQPGAKFCSYGPYNKNGTYTSESNARFDQWLKQRNPVSGIRHIEDLVALGKLNKIELITEVAMPANNMCLVWQKVEK